MNKTHVNDRKVDTDGVLGRRPHAIGTQVNRSADPASSPRLVLYSAVGALFGFGGFVRESLRHRLPAGLSPLTLVLFGAAAGAIIGWVRALLHPMNSRGPFRFYLAWMISTTAATIVLLAPDLIAMGQAAKWLDLAACLATFGLGGGFMFAWDQRRRARRWGEPDPAGRSRRPPDDVSD